MSVQAFQSAWIKEPVLVPKKLQSQESKYITGELKGLLRTIPVQHTGRTVREHLGDAALT